MPLSNSYSFFGKGNWSLDATSGSATGGGTIQADVPTGSHVEKAFLYESNFFDGGHDGGSVKLSSGAQSTTASGFTDLGISGPAELEAYRSDVTSFVQSVVGSGSASEFNFDVSDLSAGNSDGYVLAIVYSNPSEIERSITFLDGASDPAGDAFKLDFAKPVDTTTAGFQSLLSLGIGFSFQFQGSQQSSDVTVNGRLLTSAAGGEDDGSSTNGGLITVGGLGDSSNNPADPTAPPTEPRSDDELYDLAKGDGTNAAPFLANGTSSIGVTTLNASNDDNIFFAGFNITAQTSIDTDQNDVPTAVADDKSVGAGFEVLKSATLVTGNVLANDTDPDVGDTLSVASFDTTGLKGLLTSNGDGTFKYDPNHKFDALGSGDTATDTFHYTISDGHGHTASTSVTITIDGSGVTAPPTLALSPASITHPEGDLGATAYAFAVTRSGDTSGSSSANWSVAGSGTHPADATDFGAILPSGSVSFAAGETTKTITIDVAGDTAFENDEGFTLSLTSPTGATITTGTATGTITNDDLVAPPPTCPIIDRPGTQDGSASTDDTLTGPAYHNTFFIAEEGVSGHDRITNFAKDDVFATSKALYDSNGDGIITFGTNKVLDLDGPDAGIDTVSFDGLDAGKGLRFLGEGCEDVFVYATATVRPKGALEGKLGDDALAGDNPDAKANTFFFDTALDLNLGHDKITNFGGKDILVTTTKLFDSNNDGKIDFGPNHLLDLSGGLGGPGDPGLPGEVGNLDIKNTAGHSLTTLEFDGQVDHGGVHYYVYSTVGSAAAIDDLLFA